MKPPEQSLRTYYARRASEYDRIYALPERQNNLNELRDRVAAFFADRSVLEIACGTGYWTRVIARRASSILAIDCNSEVLDIAAGNDYGDCQVEFRLTDAYSLADVPRGFGAGFAGFWWSHVPLRRLGSFLAVFHSRLRTDAKVLFVDNNYVEGNSTPISGRDADGDTHQIRTLSDGSQYEVIKNFPQDQDLHRELSLFSSHIEVHRVQYYWLATYWLGGLPFRRPHNL